MSGASKGGHGRKKAHHDEEHEEHVNHEAWVIPYADMLTLLMAMFLVLWAKSDSGSKEAAAVAAALRSQLTGEIPVDGGQGVLGSTGAASGGSPVDFGLNAGRSVRAELALQKEEARQVQLIGEKKELEDIKEQLQKELDAAGLGDKVAFREEERGLVVTIVSDQVLFTSGDATLMGPGRTILDGLAGPVIRLNKPISIEGHTDSRPISTGRYPTNWELSTARATTVLRYLVDKWNFDPKLVTASGYGDTRPIGDNGSATGQAANRRVEIVIQSTVK